MGDIHILMQVQRICLKTNKKICAYLGLIVIFTQFGKVGFILYNVILYSPIAPYILLRVNQGGNFYVESNQ